MSATSAADALRRLDDLHSGFRSRYLDHAALTAQLDAWAAAFPELVRVTSIGKTPEGRSLPLLTIGRDPDRRRPSVWVDANMHASELCGSSVALAIAEDVLRLHLDPTSPVRELPKPVAARVRDVLFYICPRVSPDGAEAVLKTGRYVRSVPRDDRPNRQHARWVCSDIDGDGLALLLRVRDPGGEFVEAREVPGLLVPRRIDDEGPFYKIYPEGLIENFDGHTIPTPDYLSDNQTDLNRNFPYGWMPGHVERGAGAFPLSEPESRAVVEFTAAHPEIFLWFNLHTFGGCFIRPLGDKPDTKMDEEDLALFRQIGAWAEEHTGYPMVSGFEEFTYSPETPLHGDLIEYAYMQRGCIAYVCELWDLMKQIGVPRQKRFVDTYSHLSREDMLRLGQWDRDHNAGRAIRPWKPAHHPQLGAVEVGGVDPRVGMWNPPYDRLAEVCDNQVKAFLRVAALAPHLELGRVERAPLSVELTRVTVTVENHGYLPTYVLSSAKAVEHNEPLHVDIEAHGCELVDKSQAHRPLGHLDGWGRGLYSGGSLYYLRSRGNTGAATVSYVVRGRGTLRLRIGSCRVGWIQRAIEVT